MPLEEWHHVSAWGPVPYMAPAACENDRSVAGGFKESSAVPCRTRPAARRRSHGAPVARVVRAGCWQRSVWPRPTWGLGFRVQCLTAMRIQTPSYSYLVIMYGTCTSLGRWVLLFFKALIQGSILSPRSSAEAKTLSKSVA